MLLQALAPEVLWKCEQLLFTCFVLQFSVVSSRNGSARRYSGTPRAQRCFGAERGASTRPSQCALKTHPAPAAPAGLRERPGGAGPKMAAARLRVSAGRETSGGRAMEAAGGEQRELLIQVRRGRFLSWSPPAGPGWWARGGGPCVGEARCAQGGLRAELCGAVL